MTVPDAARLIREDSLCSVGYLLWGQVGESAANRAVVGVLSPIGGQPVVLVDDAVAVVVDDLDELLLAVAVPHGQAGILTTLVLAPGEV